jgi:magnesium transporter
MSNRSRKTVRTWKASNSEAFYNDIEDIDERPHRVRKRMDINHHAYSCEEQRCETPFHTIPVGIVFQRRSVLRWAFINRNVNRLCYLYPKKGIDIKDNFDLVLRLLLSWVLVFEVLKTSQSKKLDWPRIIWEHKKWRITGFVANREMFGFLHDFFERNDILLHRIKNIKSQRVNYDLDLLEDGNWIASSPRNDQYL